LFELIYDGFIIVLDLAVPVELGVQLKDARITARWLETTIFKADFLSFPRAPYQNRLTNLFLPLELMAMKGLVLDARLG